MASAIHLTETSDFTSAKAAVICDVCRKHVDLQTQCGSLADACGNESIEQHPSTIKLHKDAGHFDCSICLDECHDPVVTQCGHLFCWPCLYYWLPLHSLSKECPVCKENVQDKIIPLYGRGKPEHSMNSAATMFRGMHIPCRPLLSRSDVPAVATNAISARHAAPSANLGFFASMLRCGMTSLPPYSGGFFRGGDRNGASQRRFSNEKAFILRWAFIVGASIAIACFTVC